MLARGPSPEFWMNFSYGKSSKESPALERLVWTFVDCSVVRHSTDHDVVETIAKEAGVSIECLSGELSRTVYSRAHMIYGFAGDELDQITKNYDKMRS